MIEDSFKVEIRIIKDVVQPAILPDNLSDRPCRNEVDQSAATADAVIYSSPEEAPFLFQTLPQV